MENKIMQLLMEKGQVSMNNDIFPILFEEFGNAPLNEQNYTMASDFISQQLYAVYAAGINIVTDIINFPFFIIIFSPLVLN